MYYKFGNSTDTDVIVFSGFRLDKKCIAGMVSLEDREKYLFMEIPSLKIVSSRGYSESMQQVFYQELSLQKDLILMESRKIPIIEAFYEIVMNPCNRIMFRYKEFDFTEEIIGNMKIDYSIGDEADRSIEIYVWNYSTEDGFQFMNLLIDPDTSDNEFMIEEEFQMLSSEKEYVFSKLEEYRADIIHRAFKDVDVDIRTRKRINQEKIEKVATMLIKREFDIMKENIVISVQKIAFEEIKVEFKNINGKHIIIDLETEKVELNAGMTSTVIESCKEYVHNNKEEIRYFVDKQI